MSASNPVYLSVLPQAPLENVGWYARALSERDYVSQLAEVTRFIGLGFTKEQNAEGGGTVTLDADDTLFQRALPAGEQTRLVDQEAVWQVIENGLVRDEFLAEDVKEGIIPEGGGPRQTVITGRGTGCVLEWAKVLPEGMPTPTSTRRNFSAHPMAAWVQLFNEAQADGFLDWVTLLFDETADAAGIEWGGAQEITVNAGDDLLTLLKRWCEANELVWEMLPGFRLTVRRNPGRRLEQLVVFTQYKGQDSHERATTRREIANVVYAQGENGIAIASDSGSQTKWRKRAAWAQAGDSKDASSRSAVANSTLALTQDQKVSRTIAVPPGELGREPFKDFGVSDWIMIEVPDDDAQSGAMNVLGIAVQIDQDGYPALELTLQSRFDARAVKTQRQIDKLGGSSTSSGSSSPISAAAVVAETKLSGLKDVDLSTVQDADILQWNGARWVNVIADLDLLADVDTGTIPAEGDIALTYNRTSGLWEPGTVSGGGSGGMAHSYAGAQTAGTLFERVTNNRVYMKQITLAAAGLVSSIEGYINDDAAPGNIVSLAAAVMTDAGGKPGQIVAAEQMPTNSIYAFNESRWLAVALGKWLEAGTYWLALGTLNESGEAVELAYDDGGTDMYYQSGGAWLADGYVESVSSGYPNVQTTQNYSIRASVLG